MESQLDPLTDDTGGGYGNYPGLTVAQIAERFRHLAEEGHNRSARAILRIVHEQTAARGSLGVQRYLVAFGLIATLVLGAMWVTAATDAARAKLNLYLGAAIVATLLFALGASTIERTARRNKAQVREIRRLALLALEKVVSDPALKPKPLEREHLRALGEMRKIDPERWGKVFKSLSL